MATNSIKTIEFCKIIPNDSPSEFHLTLTFLDRVWLGSEPAYRLFFYEFPDPNADFYSNFLPKLKNSLSLTLQHYLPVAGYLTWPQDSDLPVVQYSAGDGISLTVAETMSDFKALSGNEFRDIAELLTLFPDFPTSETRAPVMTLQITLFPNTGFSIGYVMHHSVIDGRSVSLFMHSWAYICRYGVDSGLPPELTPSFDRSFVEQQFELERIHPSRKPVDLKNKTLAVVDMTFPLDVMLGTFRLSRENIDDLKKSVSSYREQKNKWTSISRITTFTVSSAYAWVCLVKSQDLACKQTFIGINVDARARLEPPISSTYFGNCLIGCGYGGDAKGLVSEDGFALAVEYVNAALDMLNEGVLKWAEKLNKMMSSIPEDVLRDAPVAFNVAGSPRFELYKVDFGWGRPRKVEVVSIAKTESFHLSDDREGEGGVEIGVALKKHEAELFKSVFVSGLEALLILP